MQPHADADVTLESVDIEVYSPQSPLGAAIHGKRAGDKVSYDTPNGRTVAVEIIGTHPYIV